MTEDVKKRYCKFCGLPVIVKKIDILKGKRIYYQARCCNVNCNAEGPHCNSEQEALAAFYAKPENIPEKPMSFSFEERPGACIYPRKLVSKDPDDKGYVVVSSDPETQKEIQERIDKEGIHWIFS